MKQRIFPSGLLLAIIVLVNAALYWNGNYVVYILTYAFSFVFLLCYTIFSASAILEKVSQVIVYALVLAAQILFAVLVMRFSDGGGQSFDLTHLAGVLIVFVPFLIKRLL